MRPPLHRRRRRPFPALEHNTLLALNFSEAELAAVVDIVPGHGPERPLPGRLRAAPLLHVRGITGSAALGTSSRMLLSSPPPAMLLGVPLLPAETSLTRIAPAAAVTTRALSQGPATARCHAAALLLPPAPRQRRTSGWHSFSLAGLGSASILQPPELPFLPLPCSPTNPAVAMASLPVAVLGTAGPAQEAILAHLSRRDK